METLSLSLSVHTVRAASWTSWPPLRTLVLLHHHHHKSPRLSTTKLERTNERDAAATAAMQVASRVPCRRKCVCACKGQCGCQSHPNHQDIRHHGRTPPAMASLPSFLPYRPPGVPAAALIGCCWSVDRGAPARMCDAGCCSRGMMMLNAGPKEGEELGAARPGPSATPTSSTEATISSPPRVVLTDRTHRSVGGRQGVWEAGHTAAASPRLLSV